MTTIPANVERGAEFLDERLPGWEQQIDLQTLDLSTNCDCVLGQIFKDGYNQGREVLGLSAREEGVLGFMPYGRQTYDRLTDGWRWLIGRRRGILA